MDVLVAGAGIAGLSAAIALAESGHRVVVWERTRELREIGAALSLWPNALAAVDQLGLGQAVRARAIEAPTGVIRTANGRTIVRLDTGAMRQALGGLPAVVLRAGLQAALLEKCAGLDVEVELGRAVEGVRPEGRRVRVVTSRSQLLFDGVVGADGINSRVRAAVVGGQPCRDCRRTAWRAVIPADGGLVSDAWLTVGVGLQVIAAPAPGDLVYWAADTPGAAPTVGADAGPMVGADPRDVLRDRFGDWHPPIPDMIEATPAESLIVDGIFDRPPPERLASGPVLLVGDAAHAMTPDLGQGACQGIEDAAVLLACATASPHAGPDDLFASFERVRLRRVRRIVRDSYLIGRLATTHWRVAAGTRDVMTRLLPESISNRQLAAYASAAAFRRQLDLATGGSLAHP